MGVVGLTTFLSSHGKILEKRYISNSPVVVDGNSLAAFLHKIIIRRAPFTGDYEIYVRDLKCFFRALTDCKLKPYVLCDGGYPYNKMHTAIKRLGTRIRDATVITPYSYKDYNVFPLMIRDLLFQVLDELQIEFVICNFEADHEIAALSKYLNCPVLSYDSDFYIYNVAYIPINCLNLEPSHNQNDKNISLECKMFIPGNLKKVFGINNELVPLMATVLGNDYVKRSVFRKFLRNLSSNTNKTKSTIGQCRVSAVFQWLKNETFESAIEKILSRFKKYRRKTIFYTIKKSCYTYTNLQYSYFSELNVSKKKSKEFSSQIYDYEPKALHESDDNTESETNDSDSSQSSIESCINNLSTIETKTFQYPEWILTKLRKGKISPRFFDLINKNTYIGVPQVEDSQVPDAHILSISILRFSFDLITGFKRKDMFFIGRKQKKTHTLKIPQIEDIQKNLKHKLNDINYQPDHEYMFAFLNKKISKNVIDTILKLPRDMQLFILSIIWLRAQPNQISIFNDHHIYSLILCYLMLNIILNQINGRQSSISFNKKHSKLLEELKSKKASNSTKLNIEELNSFNIDHKDCILTASIFLKYFEIDNQLYLNKKMFNRSSVSGFSQFQCCFQQMLYLNNLTNNLFGSCSISKMYNGTFLYNLYSDIYKRKNPYLYILNLLKKSPKVTSVFVTISDFVIPEIITPKTNEIKKINTKSNLIETYANQANFVQITIISLIVIIFFYIIIFLYV